VLLLLLGAARLPEIYGVCMSEFICLFHMQMQSKGGVGGEMGRGDGEKIKLGNRRWEWELEGCLPSRNGDKNRNILLAKREHRENMPTCTSICNIALLPLFQFFFCFRFAGFQFQFRLGLVLAVTFNRFSVLARLNETMSVLGCPPGR